MLYYELLTILIISGIMLDAQKQHMREKDSVLVPMEVHFLRVLTWISDLGSTTGSITSLLYDLERLIVFPSFSEM